MRNFIEATKQRFQYAREVRERGLDLHRERVNPQTVIFAVDQHPHQRIPANDEAEGAVLGKTRRKKGRRVDAKIIAERVLNQYQDIPRLSPPRTYSQRALERSG